MTLPDGKGSIQLDGWTRWVKLQVSDTPGVTISLVALAFAVAGLCLSLFVRPRRVWVRVRAGDDGHSLVEVGGLDRADARVGLSEDVAELAAELGERRERWVRREPRVLLQPGSGHLGRGLRAGAVRACRRVGRGRMGRGRSRPEPVASPQLVARLSCRHAP